MCDICGIFTQQTAVPFTQSVQCMTDILARRGPDADGYWEDLDGRFFAGFRRLAILDLSDKGNQSMFSKDGQSVTVSFYSGLCLQCLSKFNFLRYY